MTIDTLGISHSFAEQLPAAAVPCVPASVRQPSLVYFNRHLAQQLGLNLEHASDQALADCFSGSRLPSDARPVAQAYSGHQFGHFSPQLGDGRAHLLGEWLRTDGQRVDIALKGSGRTPFSRGGDGLAALGPMLREVLISEALTHLNVPSTRSLAVVATGEFVQRQVTEPGAVLARTAASHLRVGSLQFFAARQQLAPLRDLVHYSLARHYPEFATGDDDHNPALALLSAVGERQAQLIAQWCKYGFIHGVMNTDNVTLSGETIDYGPCAFMEAYHPNTKFSSIDQQGRYAYGNQGLIGHWNLSRMAEALLPLIANDPQQAIELATNALNRYWSQWQQAWRQAMGQKLGLTLTTEQDEPLIQGYLTLLQNDQVDFTLGFRELSSYLRGQTQGLQALFHDGNALQSWLQHWQQRLRQSSNTDNSPDQLADQLDRHNPYIVARNHQVEAALSAARDGNLQPFERLLSALQQPFVTDNRYADLSAPAAKAVTASYQTYCGT